MSDKAARGSSMASRFSAAYEGKRTSLPSGHHARTFAAHIAFDEHTKIRRCPGRHTALVKDLAVLRGHEIRLRLWPCSGQKRGHRRRQCPHPMDAALPCHDLCFGARWHRFPLFLRRSIAILTLTHEKEYKFCAN